MTDSRHLLVVAHTGRDESLQAGVEVCRQLIAAGLVPVVSGDERAGPLAAAPDLAPLHLLGVDVATTDLELVIVLGVTAPSCAPRSWPANPPHRCSGSTSAMWASSPRPNATTFPRPWRGRSRATIRSKSA